MPRSPPQILLIFQGSVRTPLPRSNLPQPLQTTPRHRFHWVTQYSAGPYAPLFRPLQACFPKLVSRFSRAGLSLLLFWWLSPGPNHKSAQETPRGGLDVKSWVWCVARATGDPTTARLRPLRSSRLPSSGSCRGSG